MIFQQILTPLALSHSLQSQIVLYTQWNREWISKNKQESVDLDIVDIIAVIHGNRGLGVYFLHRSVDGIFSHQEDPF